GEWGGRPRRAPGAPRRLRQLCDRGDPLAARGGRSRPRHRDARRAGGGVTALVRCRQVDVIYGNGRNAVRALSGVDLEIDGGESLGLWGRSGMGKATILHVLGSLVAQTEGAAE